MGISSEKKLATRVLYSEVKSRSKKKTDDRLDATPSTTQQDSGIDWSPKVIYTHIKTLNIEYTTSYDW